MAEKLNVRDQAIIDKISLLILSASPDCRAATLAEVGIACEQAIAALNPDLTEAQAHVYSDRLADCLWARLQEIAASGCDVTMTRN